MLCFPAIFPSRALGPCTIIYNNITIITYVLYILHGRCRGSAVDRELRPARRPCLLGTYNVGLLFYREPDFHIVHLYAALGYYYRWVG